jgi:hypothetical protein
MLSLGCVRCCNRCNTAFRRTQQRQHTRAEHSLQQCNHNRPAVAVLVLYAASSCPGTSRRKGCGSPSFLGSGFTAAQRLPQAHSDALPAENGSVQEQLGP